MNSRLEELEDDVHLLKKDVKEMDKYLDELIFEARNRGVIFHDIEGY